MNPAFTALKQQLSDLIGYADNAAKRELEFAQHYAYQALVECQHDTDDERRLKRIEAAFWHDGRRVGEEGTVRALVQVQKALELFEASLPKEASS